MGLLKDLKFELYTLHRYANKLMNKTSKTATLRAQSAPHTILVWAMMYIGKCVYLWGQSDGITLTGDVWEHWGPSSSSPSSPCLLEGYSSPSPDHSGPYLPSPGLQTSSSQSRLESKHTYILYPLTNTDIFLPPKTPPHTFHRSEQVLENLVKFTGIPGFFFLCSSRQERTKKAYAEVRPFGLFASFTMAATKRIQPYNNVTLYICTIKRLIPIKCTCRWYS